MDANKKKEFPYSDETHAIIGCAFEVLNEIGHEFHEKIYENTLDVEFGLKDIPYSQQPEFNVTYKTVKVGKYVPDLTCYEKLWSIRKPSRGSQKTRGVKCSTISR
ncbi:MAG: GxxExxY protein [Lentimonas sp.]